MTAIAYTTPNIPLILTVGSFLYLINVAEAVFARFINAGLLGSLCVGILFGSEVSNILPEAFQSAFITLGYIGLLLIVFEAGLSTNPSLLFDNILLSCTIALSGMFLPIGLSMLLLYFGFGYPVLQSFAAGAALSSTSLGTTLTMLKPAYRQTRTGTVLMAAALLDDIGGLVIAAILSQLSSYRASSSLSSIPWNIIVRPILVSLGFAFGVPVFGFISRYTVKRTLNREKFARLSLPGAQISIMIAVLSGFVSGAKYAGTSELFGAYLAGGYLSHVFSPLSNPVSASPRDVVAPILAFNKHIMPLLQVLLSPLFFASIGSALPIRSLGSVDGSSRVIWRGLVYSLLMSLAKVLVGLWMLVWPDRVSGYGWLGRRLPRRPSEEETNRVGENPLAENEAIQLPDFTRIRSAAFVGLAMVARGEIALIVAEISQPLLGIHDPRATSEPFAIVIWATLLNTAGGAISVGLLLKGQKTVGAE
ncbi:putative Na(+)/H(+) antiporter GerT [Mycena venus]|uniref:Putative Na(+)/H(+) antiporter GerT n=1 Tax=Mycena venus TaxID=2733690 RepID=A0A8H7CNV1_9AGAR|nr:putative Na(+)/H(+) antiporter GerT [Mycena venus]